MSRGVPFKTSQPVSRLVINASCRSVIGNGLDKLNRENQ
jgi:hypothetical protein